MKILDQLARMIGVRDDQVEDALQDEGRARQAVQMSRRGFFAAGATMAAAPLVPKRVYSFLWETKSVSPWLDVMLANQGLLIAAHYYTLNANDD